MLFLFLIWVFVFRVPVNLRFWKALLGEIFCLVDPVMSDSFVVDCFFFFFVLHGLSETKGNNLSFGILSFIGFCNERDWSCHDLST